MARRLGVPRKKGRRRFLCAACCLMLVQTLAASGADTHERMTAAASFHVDAHARHPQIARLSIDPQGHYLAILVFGSPNSIVVWDLRTHRKQSEIEAPGLDALNLPIQWTPDGLLTTGASGGRAVIEFWDPQSGRVVRRAPVGTLGYLRFNDNGQEAVTTLPPTAALMHRFRIYDTGTWTSHDVDTGTLQPEAVAWLDGQHVLVVGTLDTRRTMTEQQAASIDANASLKPNDVVAQIFDHDGRALGAPVVVDPSVKSTINNSTGTHTFFFSAPNAQPYLNGDKQGTVFAYSGGHLIGTRPLTVKTYWHEPYAKWNGSDRLLHLPIKVRVDFEANVAMDAEGKHLVALGVPYPDGAKNCLIEPASGESMTCFEGKYQGVSISADGKLFALGDTEIVRLFTLD